MIEGLIGFIIGIIFSSVAMRFLAFGVLIVDRTDKDKDQYRIEILKNLDDLPKKGLVTLKIRTTK